jgi:RimJ/RimL family protein N-acetyltransferase
MLENRVIRLECSAFILRPWQPGDEPSLVRHANNPRISRHLRDAFPYPYTLADAHWWIQHATAAPPNISLAIVVDHQAVGGIGLILKDDIYRRSAEIGYWLGEQFHGRGIMTEAVRTLTRQAFASYDLSRIYAGVFETNPASMRVLEKAGYQFEARLRQAITKHGRTFDELVYAIVREAS